MFETTLLITMFSIIILLILSAFFSGTETALTGASEALMHQLEKTGNKKAKIVNKLRSEKSNLIGTILIGNNLVNILASALATSLFISNFGETGVIYATIVMTTLVVMFAEILPKTYALQNSNRLALSIGSIIQPIIFLFSPLTKSTNFILRITFSIFGLKLQSPQGLINSVDELRGAIELHKGENESVSHERAMLKSVLDLSEVEVGEIMVHRKTVSMINADDSPDVILSQVLASPFTRLPIWRDNIDNIIGVLHAKEILRAINDNFGDIKGINVPELATPPRFIPETTRLLDQLQSFRDRHEHFALVIDEYGSLLGVVTMEDILEEIVGDISDEHDIGISGLRKQTDGSFLVDGKYTIRDLNRQLDWLLPDEEAATVAGLVLHEARIIPDVGQTFIFHGVRFEILKRQRNQITLLKVRKWD